VQSWRTAASWAATRRAERWTIGLGALSTVLFVARAANLPEATTARREALARHVAVEHAVLERDNTLLTLGGVAFTAEAIMACIWLVRAYTAGCALDPRLKRVSDNWLWVMWILPVVQWVTPVLRLRGLVRSARPDGSRGWLVFAWILLWAPVDFLQRRVPPPELPLDAVAGDAVTNSMWVDVARYVETAVDVTAAWTAAYAGAFLLWAALVTTIMRGLELRREDPLPTPPVPVAG
jgi:hypothetical protein